MIHSLCASLSLINKIGDNPGNVLGRLHSHLLLLLLSRLSHVRLCATPQTAAHQAPPSLGFSRQEHWSGLPFLLQCMKVKSESEVAQSYPTLSNPMDCSLPGSSVHRIFQARVLEWGAIAFSEDTSYNLVIFRLSVVLTHIKLDFWIRYIFCGFCPFSCL